MLYRICWWIGQFLFGFFYRWVIRGVENFPAEGGVIVVSNHANFLDPVIVGCSFQRKIHFMAKQELFRIPLFGSFIKALGAYPVRRGVADKAAFDASFRLLQTGQAVGLFPEGTRFKDGRIHPLRHGAAVLALRGDYPLVPMVIRNSEQIKLFRFPKVRVYIGEPFWLPREDSTAHSEKEKVQHATEIIQERMNRLWETTREENPVRDIDGSMGASI